MKLLIITGPPYSGKGTQCKVLNSLLGYKHISTGDLCRAEENKGSELGRIISHYNAKGDLVPDSVMKELFSNAIDENLSEKGIILDGYPRTIPQVDDLIGLIEQKSLGVDRILSLEVPDSELLGRAKERAKNSDRKDDQDIATHIKRIKIFETFTKPAIIYMKSQFKVLSFSGLGSIKEVSDKMVKQMNK